MKKIFCPQCKSHFSPSSHWRPLEWAPKTTHCHQGHPVATTFEARSEITARKLWTVGVVGTWLVALVALAANLGLVVGVIASLIFALIGGSLIGWLLYQFAAVPVQLAIEGGKAVAELGKPTAEDPSEGERLRKFIEQGKGD